MVGSLATVDVNIDPDKILTLSTLFKTKTNIQVSFKLYSNICFLYFCSSKTSKNFNLHLVLSAVKSFVSRCYFILLFALQDERAGIEIGKAVVDHST